MKQIKIGSALMLGLIALTGCASVEKPVVQTQVPPSDPAVVALATAANRIQKSAVELKQIQAASKLSNMTPDQIRAKTSSEVIVPQGLGTVISIEGYDGPFTTLVEAVARANGYNYLVEGVKPPVTQVIHKKYARVRAVDILRDIGYSISGANIVIDPVSKNIIVRFI